MGIGVLFLLPALPVGGAERQIAALVRGMDRSRFRPVVACQHALGPVAEEIEAAGVPVHLLSGDARLDARFLLRTVSLVRREGVRVVVSHAFSTGVAGRIAALLGGAPVRILAEHSTGEPDMSWAKHVANRLLNPLASAWVAVARSQIGYLTRVKGIPEARIHLIRNGIDPEPYAPAGEREFVRARLGIAGEAPVAGILAALRPEKDHRTFLLAARFVLDEIPAARFLVVGDGPLAEDLRREVSVLDLEGRVLFTGRRADVPLVLTAFDVSVLCSTDVETFPLAFLESMATGLPLIGTTVGGLPEMIQEEENGLLVRPRDPRGLADAMIRVLADPGLARRWGRRSRERVEREFTLEGMIRAYEELFDALLRRIPHPRSASVPGAAE